MSAYFDNVRMAEIARQLFSTRGASGESPIEGELLPGPFRDSCKQLALRLPNGVQLSVLVDADVPALFEIARLDGSNAEPSDKLTTGQVIERVREFASRPGIPG